VVGSLVDPRSFAVDPHPYREGGFDWLDELDRVVIYAGQPHLRMGTRLCEPHQWLVVDRHYQSETDLKTRLITEARSEVSAFTPGSGPACIEAADLVTQWMASYHPELDCGDLTGLSEQDAFVMAASSTQEDLCVMEPDANGQWRFTAGVVCFPTYWKLADKIGLGQAAVHGPVSHYKENLENKVSTFFDRLAPGRIVARRNWGLSPYSLLFLPDLSRVDTPGQFEPSRAWIRSERQTLRRLPSTGGVLFAIKVQIAPLCEVAARPELALRIVDAVGGWSDEMRQERSGGWPWFDQAVNWLRQSGRGGHRATPDS